jgi:hypothetical protein
LIALVPTGATLELFDLMARYARAPLVSEESPLRWGSQDYVRRLFGDRVEWLSLERRPFAPSPFADVDLLKARHPVLVTLHRDLAGEPERAAALDRRLAAMKTRWHDEPQELLLIVARKRAG